jgi:hypothetical protein
MAPTRLGEKAAGGLSSQVDEEHPIDRSPSVCANLDG